MTAGDDYRLSPGVSRTQVLVARSPSNGTLTWEHGFATQNGQRPPASISNATSIVQTADGGYAVAGGWNNPTRNSGNGARGARLLKLDASGTLQWQKAYSGSSCPPGNSCLPSAGTPTPCSTPDGGYILSGDTEDVTPSGGLTLVPWLAKASTGGALLWQQAYYQILQRTGNALTEYFPYTAQTTDGGFVSVGNTENYSTQKDELYLVKSNGTGTSNPGCGDLHPPLPLHGINPGLAPVAPGLTVQAPAPPVAAASPVTATPTAITTTTDCDQLPRLASSSARGSAPRPAATPHRPPWVAGRSTAAAMARVAWSTNPVSSTRSTSMAGHPARMIARAGCLKSVAALRRMPRARWQCLNISGSGLSPGKRP